MTIGEKWSKEDRPQVDDLIIFSFGRDTKVDAAEFVISPFE